MTYKEFGSDAFRQEYERFVNPSALRKDITSYLGEYRLALTSYDYSLSFINGKLCDIDDHEPMTTKGKRAIELRKSKWKDTSREEAELTGLLTLERQIQTSNEGDQVIWASPPGSPNDGYGDYGFIYIGSVHSDPTNGEQKTVTMSAIRVNHPSLNQFNKALSLITREPVEFRSPEEFLSYPLVIPDLQNNLKIIKDVFGIEPNPKEKTQYEAIMKRLSPHIEYFIDLVKKGSSKEELIATFNAIENYALDLKEKSSKEEEPSQVVYEFHTSERMVREYNYAPPTVAGSCGSTKNADSPFSFQSNQLFSSRGELSKTIQSENFVCPGCHKESVPPVGNSCPKCGLTKEKAAQKGFATC